MQIPHNYQPERRYIISVLLREFLGLKFRIIATDRHDVSITAGDDQELVITDKLFRLPESLWLQPESLPRQPSKKWDLYRTDLVAQTVSGEIPVIYGLDPEAPDFFFVKKDCIFLGLDILGSAFFMLTRYEEVVKTDRDEHDRFPATASLAYQENFLDRPIVNEYLEILWACIRRLWPYLKRKPRTYQVKPTHDVDTPFLYAFDLDLKSFFLSTVGDVFVRKSPKLAVQRVVRWSLVNAGRYDADPYNTFDWLMDQSERNGLQSAFYFIGSRNGHICEGKYDVAHPKIRELLRRIHERGHEIGIHPNYFTYNDALSIEQEMAALRNVLDKEEISDQVRGGRQHYLRWRNPATWRSWEEAGLEYDSTLGFADRAGFRCGVCYDYPVFDLKKRTPLRLREVPLIVMDGTIFKYMAMDLAKAADYVSFLKNNCKLFEGTFVFLWHNSFFWGNESYFDFYDFLIS